MPISVQSIKEVDKEPHSAIEVCIRGQSFFDENDLFEALEFISEEVGYKRVRLSGDSILKEPSPVIALCYRLRANDWIVSLETKATWEEIARLKACKTTQTSYMFRILIANNLDILIDGKDRIIDVPKTMDNKKIVLCD